MNCTEQYAYDEVNRLTSVDYGDGQTQSYSFDSMGNRASKTDVGGGIGGTEAYSYNAANMLLSRAGNPYLNDANGNTLSGGGRSNTWDSQNRLVSCANTNAGGGLGRLWYWLLIGLCIRRKEQYASTDY